MKKKTKKVIALACCAVLSAGIISGCSKNEENKDNSKKDTTTTTASVTTTAPITVAQKPVQVINETPCTYDSLNIDSSSQKELYDKLEKDSTIPIVNVCTNPDEYITSREEYTSCCVDIFGGDTGNVSQASAGIKVRGNSTAYYGDVDQIMSKGDVPYRIKFDDKRNVLGLHDGAECKSWVLLKGQWNLIMDYTAFKLADNIMGDDYYHSDGTMVQLYVNNEFKGIYYLCEQNQVNENRVDVHEPKEDDYSLETGYFLDIDNYPGKTETDYFFDMEYDYADGTDINGVTRKYEEAQYSIKSRINSEQQGYFIEKYMNDLFKLVYNATSKGKFYEFDKDYNLVESTKFTNAEDTIKNVCDVDSMVDMYILHEICHSYDCGEGSFYMAIDFTEDSKYPKLTFTAPWDFNWAYNDDPYGNYYAAVFNDEKFVDRYGDRSNPWFVELMTQDWFVNMVKTKWQSIQQNDEFNATIKDITSYLNKNADSLNKQNEYAVNSAYDVLEWVQTRIKWLDKQWGK